MYLLVLVTPVMYMKESLRKMEFSTEFVCMREKFDKTEMVILSVSNYI